MQQGGLCTRSSLSNVTAKERKKTAALPALHRYCLPEGMILMASRGVRSLWAVSKSKSHCISFPTQAASIIIRRFCSSKSTQIGNVGFIGTGNMGCRMANNLINAGYQVTVHDENQQTMKMFKDKGVPTKGTPFEVANASDVVITMLPSPSDVMDVYTGPNGMIHNGDPLRPWLFIDSSTVDPQTSRKLASAVSSCFLKETRDGYESPVMLDAPVSGGILAAEAGTLTFMVGGADDAYEAAKALFFTMGKSAIYCGRSGNGSAAKVCNNLVMAASMLGVSEASTLGQSLGLSGQTLTKIFNSSSARCWSSDTYNPIPGVMEGVPSSRNYEGGFASKLMAKDLRLASASAKEMGLKCPLASQAQEIFGEVCRDGHAGKDFSCVFRHYYSGKDEL